MKGTEGAGQWILSRNLPEHGTGEHITTPNQLQSKTIAGKDFLGWNGIW